MAGASCQWAVCKEGVRAENQLGLASASWMSGAFLLRIRSHWLASLRMGSRSSRILDISLA